jgi:hypothetical protein
MKEPGAGGSVAQNIGAYLKGKNALAPITVGAGNGGSAVKQVGQSIDRFANRLAQSLKYIVSVAATLGSGQSVVVQPIVETSVDDTTYTDYGTDGVNDPAATTITGNNDGSVVYAEIEVDVDLGAANEYIRLSLTPTLTRSGTDTVKFAAAAALGGLETVPT